MSARPSPRKRKKKVSPLRRLFGLLYALVFTVSLVIVAAFAASKFLIRPPEVDSQVVFPAVNPTHIPEQHASTQLVLHRTLGVYTCLILGADDGNGNADTIMLGVFDTTDKSAALISIPRDTLVETDGREHKINAAYGLGGVELVKETVSKMLAVPVDFHVMVDLDAFVAVVEELGGVWFDVPMDMDYEDPTQDLYIHVKAGYQQLNGEDAMGVVRFRYGYVAQDLERVNTQRNFLAALASQTLTAANLPKLPALMGILHDYVESDMPLDDMVYFATQAVGMDMTANLTSITLPGEWISPYIQLEDEAVLELINSLGIYQEQVPMDALNICH